MDLDSLQAKWKEEERIKYHPRRSELPRSAKIWVKDAYYTCYRAFHRVKDFPRELRWFWQRGWRGYADSDIWSIDYFLLTILPPMLRKLAKDKHGYPAMLYQGKDLDGQKGSKMWQDILEKMAYGFELRNRWESDYPAVVGEMRDGKEYYDFKDKAWRAKFDKKQKEVNKAFDESMKLFSKYFFALWD